jgi:hypothetical protein
MKFLNHLDFNENEARKMKMYRTTTSYTPSPAAAGNIILDTGANIPKWWDGSAWRDFSYGTTGTMNWNIQSDGGSNIQVDQGDTLDIAGGTLITTATSGSATAPVVTINHNNVTRTNDDTATKTFAENDASTLLVVTGITTNAQGHITEVDRTAVGAGSSAYDISAVDPTGANAVAIGLNKSNGGTTYTTVDKIEIQDGTYIDNTLVNAGVIKADLSAADGNTTGTSQRFLTKDNTWAVPSFTTNTNDNTLYNFNLGALVVGANEATLTLDASSGDDDTIKFKGTTNEIEITTPATGDAGTLQIGLPDNVVITGNLTVNGSTTTVNSNTVEIGDSIITLNSDETGTPSQNGGIEIERGTSTNQSLLWNETTSKWSVYDGTTYTPIIQDLYKSIATDSGTAVANSATDTLTITGAGGISTSRSGDTITVTASGTLGEQNLYATFTGDSGSSTASSTTDSMYIAGGTGITSVATNDKVTLNIDSGYANSALDIFKTVAVSNTSTAGTVTSQAVAAVADTATDTLNLRGLDASIALTSSDGPEFVNFKSSVLTTVKTIDVSELNGEQFKAKITHGFGTQDVIVQLWGVTTRQQVYANVWNFETNNNSVLIQFSAQPQEDIKCVIMAVNLDAGSTISYPAS